MLADLLVLRQLQDFHVVLGMDWLTRFCVTIGYGERTVIFREPEHKEFIYRGCQTTMFTATISLLRARRMLSRGCVVFLATVVEVPTAVLRLEDIPVFCEFSNIFPSELTSIPPDWESL